MKHIKAVSIVKAEGELAGLIAALEAALSGFLARLGAIFGKE